MSVGVVLSGGGPLAVAWECGVVSGLASAGINLAGADSILGTSAGAIVGAQLAGGRDAQALAQSVVDERNGVPPPGAMTVYPADALAKLPALFARAHSGEAGRAEVGAYASEVTTAEGEIAYIARVSMSLGPIAWPETKLGIVAVDVATGSAMILDRHSGASLSQAIAASCSLPGLSPPVEVRGRSYMDGGMRSSANLDLLTDCGSVVVLCFAPQGPAGLRVIERAQAQAQELEASGPRVRLIFPDNVSSTVIGDRTMDVTKRPDITIAGIGQGSELAADLRSFCAALA